MKMQIIKNKLQVILLCFYSLILISCSQEPCIDADDFGTVKFTVHATADKINGEKTDQVIPWEDSGYLLNGKPLMIAVKNWDRAKEASEGDLNTIDELSAWCPWYTKTESRAILSSICLKLRPCVFKSDNDTKYYQVINPPCLMIQGQGLYALITRLNAQDPNKSIINQKVPDQSIGLAFHAGDKTKNKAEIQLSNRKGELKEAGGILFNYDKTDSKIPQNINFVGGKLYFKILDTYYEDNGGQYIIYIKSGIKNYSNDPMQKIINLVKEMLYGHENSNDDNSENKGLIDKLMSNKQSNYGIVQKIFNQILKNPDYQLAIKATLILYVISTAILFLVGVVNVTHQELITRLIKVIFVSQLLISETAWNFFYNNLFFIFIHTPDFIMHVINEAANTGPGSDSILGLMLAPQTLSKLFSLLFFAWDGFIYIIIYIAALCFVFMVIFRATVIYLQAQVMIAIIIIMAPVFLSFALFQFTKSFFSNWLKQLVSYVIQPIILFAGIAFMSIIIRHQIYASLGFKVCKYEFPYLGNLTKYVSNNFKVNLSLFSWWFPSPPKKNEFNKTGVNIYVPEAHFQIDANPNLTGSICNPKKQYDQYTFLKNVSKLEFCESYACVEKRYIDFPFLDPSSSSDCDRLKKFFDGTFVQFQGLFLIVIVIYLLSKFNDVAISIGNFIAGTSGNLMQIQTTGNLAATSLQAQAFSLAGSGINLIKSSFEAKKSKEEAITNPKESVLRKIKTTHGIDNSNLNLNAQEDYKESVKEKIKTANPNLTDKEINNLIKSGIESNDKLRDIIAKAKYNKSYDNLKTNEKEDISKLINDKNKNNKSLADLKKDIDQLKDFQNKYAQEKQKLSQEKDSGFSEKLSKKFFTKKEPETFTDKLYSGYAGLKNYFSGDINKNNWDYLQIDDSRLRTNQEILRDKQISSEELKLKKQIQLINQSVKKDIFSSEYLAELEMNNKTDKIKEYSNIMQKDIEYKVYNSLTHGKDPVIMGDKYMREKMIDEDFKETLDNIHKNQENFIKNDKYLKNSDNYKKALNSTKSELEKYKEELNAESIDELKEKLDQGNLDQDIKDKIQNTINTYEYVEKVLNHMSTRENHIKNEYNKYTNKINEYRTKNT